MKSIYTLTLLMLAFINVNAQIPNASFENWDTTQCMQFFGPDSVAEDWQTPCTNLLAYSSGFYPSLDAYSGNYACRLEPSIVGDFAPWYVPTIMKTSFTVNFIPIAFSGYYKFESQDGDSAMVKVYFKEYNTNTSEFDTILELDKILHPIGQYTQFDIPVPEIGFQSPPDSVIIYVSSAYIDLANPYNTDGQTDGIMHVDALDVMAPVGIEQAESNELIIYPIPADNVLSIQGLDNSWNGYQLIDLLGRVVVNGSLSSNQIDVSDLTPGTYTLSLFKSESQERVQRTIIICR